MGHEHCGVVEDIGRDVTSVRPGQFVVGSFATSDNTCPHCRAGCQSSRVHREFMSGAQSPLLRVPLADGTLVATPELPPDELVPSLLAVSDVLGTGWFAADAAGVKPGHTVVVVGDGLVATTARWGDDRPMRFLLVAALVVTPATALAQRVDEPRSLLLDPSPPPPPPSYTLRPLGDGAPPPGARVVTRPRYGLAIGGACTFVTAWAVPTFFGLAFASEGNADLAWLAVPVVGPLVVAGVRYGDPGSFLIASLDVAVQVAGIVMFAVAFASPRRYVAVDVGRARVGLLPTGLGVSF